MPSQGQPGGPQVEDRPRMSLSLGRAVIGRKSSDMMRAMPTSDASSPDDRGRKTGTSPTRRRPLLPKWASSAPSSFKTLKQDASTSETSLVGRSSSKGSSSSTVREATTSASTSSHARRKSRGIFEALLPIGNRQPQPPSSFEVLRVSKGHRPAPYSDGDALGYFPDEHGMLSSPVADHGPNDDVEPVTPLAVEPQDSQRRRAQSSTSPTGSKPKVLGATARRLSNLPFNKTPSPMSAGSDPVRPDFEKQSSFNLRSIHNVRHGKAAPVGQDQHAASYFPPMSALQPITSTLPPAVSPSAVESPMIDSPSAEPASPTAMSVYEDPMTVYEGGASETAPTSPSVGQRGRIYDNASVAGSSISVAKFRAARNRSESGNFSITHDSRPASPGGALGLENAMSPAERLAALEAELAQGGRATPLIRQIQERSQSISEAVASRPSNEARPPALPEKDGPFVRRQQQARRSLQASPLLDRVSPPSSPPLSPQPQPHRSRQQRFSEKWDRSPLAWFTDEIGGGGSSKCAAEGGAALPSPSAPTGGDSSPSLRGRGMDAASFLSTFGQRGEGEKPMTLIDALAQMERREGDEILPPSKPWVRSSGTRGSNEAAAAAAANEQSSSVMGSFSDGSSAPSLAVGSPNDGNISSAHRQLLPVVGSTFEAGIVAQAARSGSRVRRPSEGLLPAIDVGELRRPEVEVVPDPSAADVLLKLASTPESTPRQVEEPVSAPAPAPAPAPVPSYFDIQPQPKASTSRAVADNRASVASIGTPVWPQMQSNLVVVNASPASSAGDTPPVGAAAPVEAIQAPSSRGAALPPEVAETALPRPEPPLPDIVPSVAKPTPTRSASNGEHNPAHRRSASVGHAMKSSAQHRGEGSSASDGVPSRSATMTATTSQSRTPARAASLSAPRRRKSSAVQHPHAPPPPPTIQSKSAELLTFHAKQAQAIARAQSLSGAPATVSLPRAGRSPSDRGGRRQPPPGIQPEYFALLAPSQQEEVHAEHQQAMLLARAAYQKAYDEAMAPLLARLPRLAHGPSSDTVQITHEDFYSSVAQPSPSHPPLPTAPSASSSSPAPRRSLTLHPSAKFMSAPNTDAAHAPPLPAIDYSSTNSGLAAGLASTTLTDDLKRRNHMRGAEPGEYSVTKRDLD